jgi:hypothetical protein
MDDTRENQERERRADREADEGEKVAAIFDAIPA